MPLISDSKRRGNQPQTPRFGSHIRYKETSTNILILFINDKCNWFLIAGQFTWNFIWYKSAVPNEFSEECATHAIFSDDLSSCGWCTPIFCSCRNCDKWFAAHRVFLRIFRQLFGGFHSRARMVSPLWSQLRTFELFVKMNKEMLCEREIETKHRSFKCEFFLPIPLFSLWETLFTLYKEIMLFFLRPSIDVGSQRNEVTL